MERLSRAPIRERLGQIGKGFKLLGELAISLPFFCGYTSDGKEVHDHSRVKEVQTGIWSSEPYNEREHGKLDKFLEEGEEVPHIGRPQGKKAIHYHGGKSATGPYEFRWE